MKTSFKIFFCIIISLSFLGAASSVPTFFEQKVKLESKLRNQVSQVLSKLTSSDSYNVNIAISVSTPSAPDWNDPDANNNKNNDKKKDKKKKEEVANEKEEEKKLDISLKNKITFDDVELPDRQEDYIVLNKFGLEAPLVEDYKDFHPDGRIVLSMDSGREPAGESEDTKDEDRELLANLMKSNKKVSEVEKLWKFNEAIDIYKNLESVDITVQLSKGLGNDVKQAAEKYVKNIAFNLGDIKPKIIFEYVNLGRDFETSDKSQKDLMDYLSLAAQFATLFGIIFGVILFGFIGNKLLQKYFELNTGNQSQSTLTMEGGRPEEEDDDSSGEGGSGVAGGQGSDGGHDLLVNGVERFQSFYENNPEDSILLIKKWIREKGKPEVRALKALVQQMDNAALGPLMKQLSGEEKVSWKESLDSGLSPEELSLANTFIGNQIIQNLMIPEYIRNPDIYAKLVKIKVTEFGKYLKKDLETACLLLPVLGTEFINKVLYSIDGSMREKVIASSLSITPQSYEGSEEKIASLLSDVESGSKIKPFLKSLEKLLPKASKSLEEGLFKHYINEASETEAQGIFKTFFPGFLINKLPEPFLKNTLNKYPLEKKVQLLYSMEQDEKKFYVDIFAPAGTKANDLVNLEFENIDRDESKQKEIAEASDELWSDFVVYMRAQIKSDQKLASKVIELTEEWYHQNQSRVGTKPSLKAVA